MKIQKQPTESEKQAFLREFREACKTIGVSHKDPEAKTDVGVKRALNKRMPAILTGRATPTQPPIKNPNREGLRLLYKTSLFHGSYPRKLKSDRQKFKHLKKLCSIGELSKEIFVDLASVLEV